MTITTKHPTSCHGIPVILDDNGEVMDYGAGLTAAIQRLGWSRAEFAARCGMKPRGVEKYWQGQTPSAAALNVLRDALEAITIPADQSAPPG